MKDHMNIGPTPCNESCRQVGNDSFEEIQAESKKYVEKLMKYFNPQHCEIIVMTFQHDFGSYSEAVVQYETSEPNAVDEAITIENHTPQTWEQMETPFDWEKVS